MVYSAEKLVAQVLVSTIISSIVCVSTVGFFEPQLGSNPATIVLTTSLTLFLSYYQWVHQYWARKKLPHLEKQPFFPNTINGQHPSYQLAELYKKMKHKGWKHGGMFTLLLPTYLPIDLNYIRNVMAKDFEHFSDRGVFYDESADPLSVHLFNLGGPKWKILRQKLSPTFSPGKLKVSYQIFLDFEVSLRQSIEVEYQKRIPIDIRKIISQHLIKMIGSYAFGLDSKTFNNEETLFVVYGKKIMERTLLKRVGRLLMNTFPKLGQVITCKELDSEVTEFYQQLTLKTIRYREENQVKRNDFMQLLIDLRNGEAALSVDEIAAQCFIFLLAGFETSASTISFAAYELAKNQKIQDRARSEIFAVLERYENQITYEALNDMKYLNQIVNETFRKYPAGSFLTRKCVKDYKVPDSDVVIEEGTPVLIPILGIHYDEEYYPNPHQFDPKRFNPENVKTRHPYAFLPFGEGPRTCIGMRFGLLQVKLALVSLLSNYKLTVNCKTEEPLKMKSYALVFSAEGEIWLDVHKL